MRLFGDSKSDFPRRSKMASKSEERVFVWGCYFGVRPRVSALGQILQRFESPSSIERRKHSLSN